MFPGSSWRLNGEDVRPVTASPVTTVRSASRLAQQPFRFRFQEEEGSSCFRVVVVDHREFATTRVSHLGTAATEPKGTQNKSRSHHARVPHSAELVTSSLGNQKNNRRWRRQGAARGGVFTGRSRSATAKRMRFRDGLHGEPAFALSFLRGPPSPSIEGRLCLESQRAFRVAASPAYATGRQVRTASLQAGPLLQRRGEETLLSAFPPFFALLPPSVHVEAAATLGGGVPEAARGLVGAS